MMKEKMMKNKKGWLLIVEAVMAVMILFGFVFAAIAKYSQETKALQEKPSLYDAAGELVARAQENDTVRNQVLASNEHEVNNSLKNEINKMKLNVNVDVCIVDFDKNCNVVIPEKEVYSAETIISTDLIDLIGYKPKKLKVFVWER